MNIIKEMEKKEEDITFENYTIEEFNIVFGTNWSREVNTEDFLEYLETTNSNYMYASYDKDETIIEYKDYLEDTGCESELVCVDGLYLALY